MKRMNKILAILLAVIMLFSCIPFTALAEDGNNTVETEDSSDVSYKATNALGEIITDAMNSEEQDEYGVKSVVIDGTTATATFLAPEETTLVVAIYDEDSMDLISIGNVKVGFEMEETTIELSDYELPEYYIVRAFLFNNDKEAICKKYEDLDHTRAYAEFLSKTIYDFDDENVINLDNTYDNNFAVVADDAVIAKSTNSKNIVISYDKKTATYVIDRADNAIKNLSVGEVVYMDYGTDFDDYMLVKVGSISVNGNVVTIIADENFEIAEVFDYIKIDTDKNGSVITSKPQGSPFFLTASAADDSADEEYTNRYHSISFEKSFKKENCFEVSFEGSATLTASIKFYYDALRLGANNIEFFNNTKIEVSATTTVEFFKGFNPDPWDIADISFMIVPGVEIFAKVSLSFSINGKVSVTGGLYITLERGIRFTKNGVTEYKPNPVVELKWEASVSVEIALTPQISIGVRLLRLFSVDATVKAKFLADVTVDIASVSTTDDAYPDQKHDCAFCAHGEFKVTLTCSINVKFGLEIPIVNQILQTPDEEDSPFSTKTLFSYTFAKWEHSFGKFYISKPKGGALKFGWGECPNKTTRVEFIVYNQNNEVVSNNVKITKSGSVVSTASRDNNGRTVVYLVDGQYRFSPEFTNEYDQIDALKTGITAFTLNSSPLLIKIYIKEASSGETPSDNERTNFYIYKADGALASGEYTINIKSGDSLVATAAKATDGCYTAFIEAGTYIFDLGSDTDTIVDKTRTVFTFTKSADSAATISIYLVEGAGEGGSGNGGEEPLITSGQCGDNLFWNYENGVLYITGTGNMWDYSLDNPAPWYVQLKDLIVRVEFEEGATSIGNYAFYDMAKLVKCVIPESLVHIGDYAFSGCVSIERIAIPEKVTYIGIGAFTNCTNMISYSCAGTPTYGGYVFSGCKKLKEIILPEGVLSVGAHAFENCVEINRAILPESLQTIAEKAFYGCDSLTEIYIKSTNCSIFDSADTIPEGATIYGNLDSTAEAYAEKYGRNFVYLDIWGQGDCGSDGDNVKWILWKSGLMEIFGTGDMADFSRRTAPWDSYYRNVKSIFIYSGVTSIGDWAFCFTSPFSITIPYGITRIGKNAFYGCSTETIIVPDGMTEIGTYAFYNCYSENINIPDGVTSIGSYAFCGCNRIKCISLPNTVISLGSKSFSDCTSLEEINVPRSISSAGAGCFEKCDTCRVEIEDGLTSIPRDLFNGADVDEIVIPSTVKSFYLAFPNSSIATINYLGSLEEWLSLDNYYMMGYIRSNISHLIIDGIEIEGTLDLRDYSSIGRCAFSGCDRISSVIISKSTSYIGNNAFAGCANLKTAIFEDGTLSIPNNALSGCNRIETVIIPDSVKTIGTSVFYGCSSIEQINLPDEITIIPSQAFYGCKKLSTIDLPDNLISIDDHAFYNCSGLSHILFSDIMTSVGAYAFSGCSGLVEIQLPNSVQTIGSNAFEDCTGITSFTIPDQVVSIGSSALKGTNISQITIPKNVKDFSASIYYGSFSGCDNLTTVYFSDDVTEIPNYALQGASNVTEVHVPNDLQKIGASAFRKCSSLITFEIPENVENIGSYAFYETGLTRITIPDGVTYIGDAAFSKSAISEIIIPSSVTDCGGWPSPFADCDNLTTVSFADDITCIPNYILSNASNITSILLSDNITEIGAGAFRGTSITSANLPDNIQTIGGSAFENCVNLSDLHLPNKLKTIGYLAFSGCVNLTEVQLPENLNELGGGAFAGTKISEIVVPASITSINVYWRNGLGPFSNCSELREISFANGTIGIPDYMLYNSSSLISINIPSSVTTIGRDAFTGCTSLSSITLPEGISFIDYRAFANTGLTEIELPASFTKGDYGSPFSGSTLLNTVSFAAGTTTIPKYTFDNPGSVNIVIIPASVNKIEARAFYDCATLSDIYYEGSASDWESIWVDSANDALNSIVIHYNSTGPQENSSTMSVSAAPVLASLASRFFPVASAVETMVDSTATTVHCAILGREYVILAVNDNDTEDFFSSSNLIYIDQQTAETKTVTFDVPASVQTAESIFITGPVEHNYAESVITLATCTTDGQKQLVCTECGEISGDTEIIPATGHKYGTWTIVREANCVEEGIEQRVCENDSAHIETREIAKTAHIDTDADGICDECGVDINVEPVEQESNCVCGKYHTGPFAWLVKFFHKIVYFFKNLFHKN